MKFQHDNGGHSQAVARDEVDAIAADMQRHIFIAFRRRDATGEATIGFEDIEDRCIGGAQFDPDALRIVEEDAADQDSEL